jgi:hypothetical protein
MDARLHRLNGTAYRQSGQIIHKHRHGLNHQATVKCKAGAARTQAQLTCTYVEPPNYCLPSCYTSNGGRYRAVPDTAAWQLPLACPQPCKTVTVTA